MSYPLLLGIADNREQIKQLVAFLNAYNVEEIFAEAINQRGPGPKCTEEALRESGSPAEAAALVKIRRADRWSDRRNSRLTTMHTSSQTMWARPDYGRALVLKTPALPYYPNAIPATPLICH
ncbi:MAG: hypothetical protein ABFC77_05410 [Thermoguttaceae bacterium]